MTANRIAAGVGLALLSGPALAHSPIKGLDSFYAGLLHPLFVPAHVLPLLALGVFFGQAGPRRIQAAIATFTAAAALGLLVTGIAAPQVPAAELALLGVAVVIGLMIALDREFPLAIAVSVAAAVGFAVGIDSEQGALVGRERVAAMVGTGVGVYMLPLYAMAFGEYFSRLPWQRIGLRVLGSWAAASALLVLSLGFAA